MTIWSPWPEVPDLLADLEVPGARWFQPARADIPRLLSLDREGKLLLDETVTHEYKLAEVNEGYEDMRAGKNIRGVVLHDH